MNPYRSPLFVILAVFVVVVLFAILRLNFREARDDRNWEPEFASLTTFADLGGGRWRLNNLRSWTWNESGPGEKIWGDRIIDENAVTALWYYVQPFGGWDGIAHTFLVFELGGKDSGEAAGYIGVSVEARRQIGEVYSALAGLFRAYELSYLWASEKDLLTRRAVYLPDELYGYRLNVTPQTARAALRHFIARTNDLAARPRFYNTLFSNCTNELAKTVNDGEAFIPYHYSFVLTGFADRYLHRLGYLGEPDSNFAVVRGAGHLNAIVRANAGASEKAFSKAVRAGLKAVAGPGRQASADHAINCRRFPESPACEAGSRACGSSSGSRAAAVCRTDASGQ